MSTHIKSAHAPRTQPFVNGAIAGIAEVLFTHPIDVYKTQMQNQLANKYVNTHVGGTNQASLSIYRKLNVYYSGFGARLCAIVPMRLTFWGMQDVSNQALQSHTSWTPVTIGVMSGIIAGCAQTLVDAPTEWLKIQRITNPSMVSMTYWKAMTMLVHHQHIPGFLPTLYRNIIVVCCLNTGMLCYGQISVSTIANSSQQINEHKTIEHIRKQQFAISTLSSLIGSCLSHPFDVVKTSMQRTNTQHLSMCEWFKTYLNNKPLSLWTGVVPRCSQVMLSMGIGSVVFYGLK